MQCPRLHGEMARVALDDTFESENYAWLCQHCGGLFMSPDVWKEFLGMQAQVEKKLLTQTFLNFPCLECGNTLKTLLLHKDLPAYHCSRCHSFFLDGAIFPILLWKQSERETGQAPFHSPVDPLSISCSDCNSLIHSPKDAHPSALGFICDKCYHSPPILSENKTQNVQSISFRAMEVKIDHRSQSSHSRIAVTPAQPCLLNIHFENPNWKERLLRLKLRSSQFDGELRKKLYANQDFSSKTPAHVFLKQRGVTSLLLELSNLGRINIDFKPHNISFDLVALRISNEIRLNFETLVRRLLIAYNKFVELSQRYENS